MKTAPSGKQRLHDLVEEGLCDFSDSKGYQRRKRRSTVLKSPKGRDRQLRAESEDNPPRHRDPHVDRHPRTSRTGRRGLCRWLLDRSFRADRRRYRRSRIWWFRHLCDREAGEFD